MQQLACTGHWLSCNSSERAAALRRQHGICLPVRSRSCRTASHRSFPKQSHLTGPQVVWNYRPSLARAAVGPFHSIELQELVSRKLDISSSALKQLLAEELHQDTVRQQGLADAHLPEVELGLDKMLQLFSSSEIVYLLGQQPALLAAPLASWLEFFDEYGFTRSQTKNLISQTPEVLVKGSLVTAGEAIMHLKHLGFDNDEVRHKVVSYCPQVLMMGKADIDTLISLWSKFQVGVDERAGM